MSKLKLYNVHGRVELQVDLSQEIDRGGEGAILPHPNDKNQVLKIYHDGLVPCFTPQSFTYLCQLGPRFIKPEELYFTQTGEVKAFRMRLLEKSFFRISQLFTKSQCTKLGITGDLKTKIAQELVSMMEEVHSLHLVIGDFNPYNIFINLQGEVRLLDVDSCETPVTPHSGRLLDEIRDHYYLGKVSYDSDCYALAITIFRLFTYVHPYKGVHSVWKSLEERAIKKISVLSNDPGLTIPAFYERIADPLLEIQFKRIFEDGERFPVQILQPLPMQQQVTVPTFALSHITVKVIAHQVLDFYFNETLGYIKTIDHTELFHCDFQGNLSYKESLDNTHYQSLWVGNANIIQLKNNKLYLNNLPLTNFEIPENFQFVQMGHLIFGVDWEHMYILQPDRIIHQNIAWSKNPSWGRGYRFDNAPIQNTGGIIRTHYRHGDSINTVKLPIPAKNLIIKENAGILTHVENEKLKHQWFYINGLNVEMGPETEEIFSFAVRQTAGGTFAFVPRDGEIEIVRTPDFSVVDRIAFAQCTSQSQLFLTRSGLLLLENQILYLINRNA